MALPGPWRHHDVSANGIRLHVVEADRPDRAGQAPLVLLLHGFPGFWWSWRHQLVSLASTHRVVACDLRGYGGSDRPPRGYDLWTLAGDVAGLVRALGARRAAVVGAGWGGAVGWTLAALHPGAVDRLAVVGTPHPLALRRAVRRDPLRQGRALLPALAVQVPRLPEHRLRRDGAARVARLLAEGGGPGWPAGASTGAEARGDDEVARHRAAMGVPRVPHCALEYFRWAVRSQFRPDGRRFAAAVDHRLDLPVLALYGAEDPWVTGSAVHASARWCTDLTVRRLEGVGHFPHQEAPERTGAELAAFLR